MMCFQWTAQGEHWRLVGNKTKTKGGGVKTSDGNCCIDSNVMVAQGEDRSSLKSQLESGMDCQSWAC
jgi:hypothetical protein